MKLSRVKVACLKCSQKHSAHVCDNGSVVGSKLVILQGELMKGGELILCI